MTGYRAAVDDLKAKLVVWLKDPHKTRLVSQALDASTEALAVLIRTAFPKAIRLEERLGEFFALLPQARPPSSTSRLEFPDDVGRLEAEIIRAMRSQVGATARYLEAMQVLFPSTALRTRVTITTILDVMYRATADLLEADESTRMRELERFGDAIARARAMTHAESGAADVRRISGVTDGYVQMLGHFDAVLAVVGEVTRERDAPRVAGDPALLRQAAERLMTRMETALDSVEKLALRIDGAATECLQRTC
jgi:hypothetical protein